MSLNRPEDNLYGFLVSSKMRQLNKWDSDQTDLWKIQTNLKLAISSTFDLQPLPVGEYLSKRIFSKAVRMQQIYRAQILPAIICRSTFIKKIKSLGVELWPGTVRIRYGFFMQILASIRYILGTIFIYWCQALMYSISSHLRETYQLVPLKKLSHLQHQLYL